MVEISRYVDLGLPGTEFDEWKPGVLRLTLTGDNRWNTIHHATHEALPELFALVSHDPDVKVFTMAAAGDAFSSGSDLDGIPSTDARRAVELQRIATRIITQLLEIPQPTVCVMPGPAIGLGASLALQFDFIVAAEGGYFMDPHMALGIVPGDGLIAALTGVLGRARLNEILLLGEKLPVADARQAGLVNAVVSHEEVESTADRLVSRILALPPLPVRLTKMVVMNAVRQRAEGTMNLAMSAEAITLLSADHTTAVQHFRDHRSHPTSWAGR